MSDKLVYDQVVSSIILDVIIEVHRLAKTRGLGSISQSLPAVDTIFCEKAEEVVENKKLLSLNLNSIAARGIICSCCGQRVSPNKYAQHLEKCMFGLTRQSNLRNSQHDIGVKKRRKN